MWLSRQVGTWERDEASGVAGALTSKPQDAEDCTPPVSQRHRGLWSQRAIFKHFKFFFFKVTCGVWVFVLIQWFLLAGQFSTFPPFRSPAKAAWATIAGPWLPSAVSQLKARLTGRVHRNRPAQGQFGIYSVKVYICTRMQVLSEILKFQNHNL